MKLSIRDFLGVAICKIFIWGSTIIAIIDCNIRIVRFDNVVVARLRRWI